MFKPHYHAYPSVCVVFPVDRTCISVSFLDFFRVFIVITEELGSLKTIITLLGSPIKKYTSSLGDVNWLNAHLTSRYVIFLLHKVASLCRQTINPIQVICTGGEAMDRKNSSFQWTNH